MAVKLPNTSGPPYDAILVPNNTNYVGNLSAQVIDTVLSGNLNFLSNAQLTTILQNYLLITQFEPPASSTSTAYAGYPYLGFFVPETIVSSVGSSGGGYPYLGFFTGTNAVLLTQVLDSGSF